MTRRTPWPIRSYRADRYREFALERGQHLLNLNDYYTAYDRYGDVRDGREGAVPRYIDLPMSDYKWLYTKAERLVRKANTALWGFKLTGWNQPLRLNVYPTNSSFVAHSDHCAHDRSKVAFVMPITMAKDGGSTFLLDVDLPRVMPGDVLIFPAFHPHGVYPVKAGTRVSLAGWATGPRFT
jgi:hypothetical protein